MTPNSQLLAQVTEDTFASMAFLFPGGDDAGPGDDRVTLSVAFAGPHRGRLEMSLPKAILNPLAVNMLGLDEGQTPAPDQKADAVKEVLNVICGNLLPLIDDPKAVYDVSPPVLEPTNPPAALPPAASARVALEEGTVELRLFQDAPATVDTIVPAPAVQAGD